MLHKNFTLNSNQDVIADLKEGVFLVLAGAGSGKTACITERVKRLIESGVDPREILLLTFTNRAAREMLERIVKALNAPLQQLWAGTFHAIAARALRKVATSLGYASERFTILDDEDAEFLIKNLMKEILPEGARIKPNTVRHILSYCENTRCDMANYLERKQENLARWILELEEIGRRYRLEKIKQNAMDFDDLLVNLALALRDNTEFRAELAKRFRFIIVDEGQDTSLLQWDIIRHLSEVHGNIMVVGDDAQCFVPGTLISTPIGEMPIETLKEGDFVLAAKGFGQTDSYRVTKVKKKLKKGQIKVITTKSGKQIRCTPDHVLFTRTTKDQDHYYVYLMHRSDLGYRIGITRSYRASNGKMVFGVEARARQEKATSAWVLKACPKKTEALVWEQIISTKYGIPQTCFEASAHEMTEQDIAKIFKETDSRNGAALLAKDLRTINLNSPHWANKHGDRAVTITYLSRRADKRSMTHKIDWETPNEELAKKAITAGFKVKKAKPFLSGKSRWRASTERIDYAKALSLGEEMSSVLGIDLVQRFNLTGAGSWDMTPAQNIFPGMELPTITEEEIVGDIVVSIEDEDYQGFVYDLNVDKVHNYIANDIFVHNCIYSFRGASVKDFLEFPQTFPSYQRYDLKINYRSRGPIVALANASISYNLNRYERESIAAIEEGELPKVIEYADEDEEADVTAWTIKKRHANESLDTVAILFRAAYQAARMEIHLARRGIPYKIKGASSLFAFPHIKAPIAWLRAWNNPKDKTAWMRIITLFPGIGTATFEKLWRQFEQDPLTLIPQVQTKAKGWLSFVEIFEDFQEAMESGELFEALRVIAGDWYREMLRQETPLEYLDKLVDLDTFINIFQEHRDLQSIMDDIALLDNKKDDDAYGVQLGTIHSVKGLEFRHVYMIGLNDGRFPISKSMGDLLDLEEERRIFYVGVTRAIETLNMSYPETVLGHTFEHELAEPSMFLTELPEHLVDWHPRPVTID